MRRRFLATLGNESECPPVRGDDALIADGWYRRYLTAAEHAEEARELYLSLGFEVLLQSPQPSQIQPACEACREVACRDYVLVYTRKRESDD